MADEPLRSRIETLLASGLPTRSEERADTSEKVASVVQELHDVTEVEEKLVIAGFLPHPYGGDNDATGLEQECKVCMYFDQHERLCTLPELMLPVEPQWSCTLWRV